MYDKVQDQFTTVDEMSVPADRHESPVVDIAFKFPFPATWNNATKTLTVSLPVTGTGPVLDPQFRDMVIEAIGHRDGEKFSDSMVRHIARQFILASIQ